MNRDHPSSGPPRLAQTTPEAAELFTKVESAYRRDLDEASAWEALRLRLAFPESARPPAASKHKGIWIAFAAAAAMLLTWFGWNQYRSIDAMRAHATKQPTPASSSHVSIRLAPGKSQLADGTLVELTDDAQGMLVADSHRSSLRFDRGRLNIHVAHQSPGHSFAVKVHDVEFVVLGTRFSVVAREQAVTLDVSEGKVLVKRAAKESVIVQAGQHWSSSAEVSANPAPSSAVTHPLATSAPSLVAPVEKTNDVSHCRGYLRDGKPQQAQDCYLQIAAGKGLSAEMALYEVARLRRDVLSNPSSSLAALDDYEARFPSGTLAPEVRQARVDLLSRLGRFDEALSVSNQLLASSVGRARATELRLLRGNLLRDKKHDCAGAIAEYRWIESDPGPRGDQAAFAIANCLERLGRTPEAISAYRRYLDRSQPAQAAQARQRLSQLSP
jgi:hypothetical protein